MANELIKRTVQNNGYLLLKQKKKKETKKHRYIYWPSTYGTAPALSGEFPRNSPTSAIPTLPGLAPVTHVPKQLFAASL